MKDNIILSLLIFMMGIFFEKIWQAPVIDVKTALTMLSLLLTIWLAKTGHLEAKEREIKTRLFPEKKKAYEEIVTVLFDLMRDLKESDTTTFTKEQEKDLENKMWNLKTQLLFYGSQKFISKFMGFSRFCANPKNDDKAKLDELDCLFRIMRKDLGNPNDSWWFGFYSELFILKE